MNKEISYQKLKFEQHEIEGHLFTISGWIIFEYNERTNTFRVSDNELSVKLCAGDDKTEWPIYVDLTFDQLETTLKEMLTKALKNRLSPMNWYCLDEHGESIYE